MLTCLRPSKINVFPNFVTDRGHVKTHAIFGEHRKLLLRKNRGAGIERIVEDDRLGARRKGALKVFSGKRPARRLQIDKPRHASGSQHERQVSVVHRLEENDLVSLGYDGENSGRERLRSAGRDHRLPRRVEFKALEAHVMGRNGLAQLWQPHHRGVLVPAAEDGVRRHAPDILRPGIIRKSLAEIHGVQITRKTRHDVEYGRWQLRKDGIHGGFG
jgi:hypothetical protein